MVKVIEECQISPPPGSVPPTSLPLTPVDLGFLITPPVERLFFYEFHHTTTHFMSIILPNIKHSLSLTLQHFYPLAGNLTWPQESTQPELVYKAGDAVSFTVAESDHDFYHLSGNHVRDVHEFYHLIPKIRCIDSSEKLFPGLALQVTIFPFKGICMGVSISHSVSDGRASMHFMKSWASVCRSNGDTSILINQLPFCDRSTFKYPSSGNIMKNLAQFGITNDTLFNILNKDPMVPLDKVQATFALASSDIKRLKLWILSRSQNENQIAEQLHFSSLVAACAYVWVCLIKARWGETDTSDDDAVEYFLILADARARLDPPLPATYFGNCILGAHVMAKRRDLLGKDGIAIAAKLIRLRIQNINMYEESKRELSDYISVPPKQVVTVAGSPKFGVYEIDFGWGKPTKVEMSSIRHGESISLSECPNEEGGLEIGMVRNKIEMDAFASFFANSLGPIS